jgi:hypothetical protein
MLLRAGEMVATTKVKYSINNWLAKFNLHLDTLTAERHEREGLTTLSALNDVAYTFDDHNFTTPDAEVLYTLVRKFKPRMVVQVGSGNSTKVTKQAIRDGELQTRIVAIDPHPRIEIEGMVDELHRAVEFGGETVLFDTLQTSASSIRATRLRQVTMSCFCTERYYRGSIPVCSFIFHGTFLPYDYLATGLLISVSDRTSSTLVHALLTFGDHFEVVWAGYHLQHTSQDFQRTSRNLDGWVAQSLWLRKKSPDRSRNNTCRY